MNLLIIKKWTYNIVLAHLYDNFKRLFNAVNFGIIALIDSIEMKKKALKVGIATGTICVVGLVATAWSLIYTTRIQVEIGEEGQ